DLAAVIGSLGDARAAEGKAGIAEEAYGEARRLIDTALDRDPDQALWQLTRARLLARSDRAAAERALAAIMGGDTGPVDGLAFPLTFSHLDVELETTSHSLAARPGDRAAALRKLVSWQAAVSLGDLVGAGPDGRSDPGAGAPYYQVACDLRPDLPESQIKLGDALLAAGEAERAAAAFQAALADNPLSIEATRGLVAALPRAGDLHGAVKAYDDFLACTQAVPALMDGLPEVQRAYWEAVTLVEAGRGREPLALDGLRSANYLLFAEGDGWLAGLDAYARDVQPGADACLVVYSAMLPVERVVAAIEDHLRDAGRDPASLADVIVVERRLAPAQEQELLALAAAVYPCAVPLRVAQAAAAGKPVIADFPRG
ncbi:MAG: hypothetical protein FJZ01_21055, partial [Candidatus Sericytochromatia bacterium]|nr:hypothetical protein [Candidatus Tanganyikabacteria bacterium]